MPGKRLVYIEAQVNKEIIVAMLDNGATSNFYFSRRSLKNRPQATTTQPLARVVKGVRTKVGR
ncbi:unnamed protein product [Spirodela intermedia]|uniref:Uncharacterized protein n=1 Tax=Spirodela intermedia TaxID=51605 RepID=A0A7I8JSA1_SPIIN|nr:unnamed protein product [Spirodela intermedia]CAA6673087.1 unnamed protein product [Spirodela intermedia]